MPGGVCVCVLVLASISRATVANTFMLNLCGSNLLFLLCLPLWAIYYSQGFSFTLWLACLQSLQRTPNLQSLCIYLFHHKHEHRPQPGHCASTPFPECSEHQMHLAHLHLCCIVCCWLWSFLCATRLLVDI